MQKIKLKARKSVFTIASITDDERFKILTFHFKETSTKAWTIKKAELKHVHPRKDDKLVFFETTDGEVLKVELNGKPIHVDHLYSDEVYELDIVK